MNELTKPIDLVIQVNDACKAFVTCRYLSGERMDYIVWAVYCNGQRMGERGYNALKPIVKSHLELNKKKYSNMFRAEHRLHLVNAKGGRA